MFCFLIVAFRVLNNYFKYFLDFLVPAKYLLFLFFQVSLPPPLPSPSWRVRVPQCANGGQKTILSFLHLLRLCVIIQASWPRASRGLQMMSLPPTLLFKCFLHGFWGLTKITVLRFHGQHFDPLSYLTGPTGGCFCWGLEAHRGTRWSWYPSNVPAF